MEKSNFIKKNTGEHSLYQPQLTRSQGVLQNTYASISKANNWHSDSEYKERKNPTTLYKFEKDLYIIPFPLKKIHDRIIFSEKILSLEDNWDDNGSEKISSETWAATVSFIINYSKTIYNNERNIIDTPKIYPSAQGSIDIDWETDSYGLLINIAKGGRLATYYGDNKADQKTEGVFNPIEFNINLLPKAISHR